MEPPGTAPGSDPLITSAFMSIVPEIGNSANIGGREAGFKAWIALSGLLTNAGLSPSRGQELAGEDG
ncbi:hypothetical protein TP2_09610 [Thioclava pacifica DSM 10166]|uniref:Uncharacterized protein n=1 Tax=Thioclava pacifica DSM 10166 TaxID=1353537 RepID=A0A074J787_9RHOB|nr:hypothetical protein TP2_09610 [Thioclava pacifica DSM 10166]